MKKFLIILTAIIILLFGKVYAEDSIKISGKDVVTFSENDVWGLKDKKDNIIIQPTYIKMIRLGDNAWIVQNKRKKFGLIDNQGQILIPIKYNHTERYFNRFVKFGNVNDFGIYNEYGEIVVPAHYSKIDILYGKMFLTYKNYKYGIVGFDGKTILENEYDDIYMPKRNVMRILYQGRWIELEQVNAENLTLPEDAKNKYVNADPSVSDIVVNTGVMSGYSVLTFSDYVIKLVSSISPAHEDTIDELMFSQGAETVSIFMKLSWIPKYPFVYIRKYYQNIRNPNSGPLTDIRNELKQQMK